MIDIDIPKPLEIIRPSANQVSWAEGKLKSRGFENRHAGDFAQVANWYAFRAVNPKINDGRGRRGVMLFGKCGNGKTTALKAMRLVSSTTRLINILDLQKLYSKSKEDASEWLVPNLGIQEYPPGYFDLVLDDIGRENTMNLFGNKFELFADVVEDFYRMFKGRHVTLFSGATNLTQEQLVERYGERVMSRLREMCLFMTFENSDQRR